MKFVLKLLRKQIEQKVRLLLLYVSIPYNHHLLTWSTINIPWCVLLSINMIHFFFKFLFRISGLCRGIYYIKNSSKLVKITINILSTQICLGSGERTSKDFLLREMQMELLETSKFSWYAEEPTLENASEKSFLFKTDTWNHTFSISIKIRI